MIILGLFAGVGAPVSGKLIDRFGARIILAFGFACSIVGALFMIFVTMKSPSMITVMTGLALSGLGMGFTMGTPVNYMMLANTDKRQSNSALAALSLVRSVGTAIAPAIMVGFIANAGMSVQGDIMKLLPQQINMPELPYAQEISSEISELRSDPQMKEKMAGIEIPDIASMKTVSINMSSGSGTQIPADTLALLQSSDVTTITDNTKTMAKSMFMRMSPGLIKKIQDGIDQGIKGIENGKSEMQAAGKMMSGMGGKAGTEKMKTAAAAIEGSIKGMDVLCGQLQEMKAAVPDAFNTALENYLDEIEKSRDSIEKAFQNKLNRALRGIYSGRVRPEPLTGIKYKRYYHCGHCYLIINKRRD